MVRVCDIPRTAAFAWSSSAIRPQIVTGTKAGAVDANFSDDSSLEIWDLHVGKSGNTELQPSASITTESKYEPCPIDT